MLKYAIIGFGGLGKCHFRYTADLMSKVEDIELVALCDVEKDAFKKQTNINISSDETELDLSKYNLYTDAEELMKKEKLDFIISVVPTFLHDKIAIMAMEKGIHVFSEKPIAITVEKAQNMIDCAKKNNVKLMIGQCLRYWPEYKALKEIIDNKEYGNVLSATFTRLSGTPRWSWQNWYLDESKSGGSVLDLHVHDVDFINWVFGKPISVTSRAANYVVKHDYVSTMYDYGDMYIVATAGWGMSHSYPFTAEFTVRFENGVVELKNGKFMAYTNDGEKEIKTEQSNAYVNEIIDFVDCIRNDRTSKINPPESSKLSIEIAFAEKASADTKETVKL